MCVISDVQVLGKTNFKITQALKESLIENYGGKIQTDRKIVIFRTHRN